MEKASSLPPQLISDYEAGFKNDIHIQCDNLGTSILNTLYVQKDSLPTHTAPNKRHCHDELNYVSKTSGLVELVENTVTA